MSAYININCIDIYILFVYINKYINTLQSYDLTLKQNISF